MKNTKTSQAIDSKEMAVSLSDFNYKIKDFEDEKIFVFKYQWNNIEKQKTWKKSKLFGLQGDEKRLKLLWFKAQEEEEENGSLAYFGQKWFLQTCIEEWILSEELV